jgi:hypothetical protein
VIRATTYDAISMDDNYGLLYNNASTEAEKTMNELWLARRRQEVINIIIFFVFHCDSVHFT